MLRPGRQDIRPDRERLEKERLAGYERQRPLMQQQRSPQRPVPMPPPQRPLQASAAPPSSSPRPATPAAAAPPSSSQAADALGQMLLKKVHEKVQEDTKQLRGLVDSVSLRLGALENTVKSLEHAVSSLREEFSGIAQVAGGSVAKKTEDVEGALQKLEKSFSEFSTRLDTEMREVDRRQGSMMQELLAGGSAEDACQLANMAYARSIVVPCRVVAADGVVLEAVNGESGTSSLVAPAGTAIALRYPMSEKGDDVTMVYTQVTEDGDVREYVVPVQRAGVMTVKFLPDTPSFAQAAS